MQFGREVSPRWREKPTGMFSLPHLRQTHFPFLESAIVLGFTILSLPGRERHEKGRVSNNLIEKEKRKLADNLRKTRGSHPKGLHAHTHTHIAAHRKQTGRLRTKKGTLQLCKRGRQFCPALVTSSRVPAVPRKPAPPPDAGTAVPAAGRWEIT